MSIYHKVCPRCAATVATYINRCACGFSFGGSDYIGSAQELAAAAEEEQLYEEYLTARARQASAAVEAESRNQPVNALKA